MANVSHVFNALGDPTRRAVFQRLRGGARSVTEISRGMAVTRPAVSQHLKVLKNAKLVTLRAEGTRRLYAVDPRGMETIREWLDSFWDTALLAFQVAAEREAKKGAKR